MMITEKKFLTISVHPEFISRNRYYCSCNVMAIEWCQCGKKLNEAFSSYHGFMTVP